MSVADNPVADHRGEPTKMGVLCPVPRWELSMHGRTRRGAVIALVVLSVLLIGALYTWGPWERGSSDVAVADALTADGDGAIETQSTSSATDDAGEDDDAVVPSPQVSAGDAEPRPGVASEMPASELKTEESADALVQPLISQQASALGVPTGVDWESVVAVADGSLLDSIENSVLEYSENRWTQVGSPTLVSATVLDVDDSDAGPVAVLEVCLDHSEVDLVDAGGVSLTNRDSEMRVRSILTMRFLDDRWVATQQDFTDQLTC